MTLVTTACFKICLARDQKDLARSNHVALDLAGVEGVAKAEEVDPMLIVAEVGLALIAPGLMLK